MAGRDPGDIPLRRGAVNLVEALSAARTMPVEALDLALERPGRLVDPVLAVLERAAGGDELDDRAVNLLFWGTHVLAAARERRVFGPLVALCRVDPERLERFLGPAVAGTLPRLVASAFDGDADPLEAALFDGGADEYARWSLWGAYAFLAADGAIPAERADALLRRFGAERPNRAGDAGWTGWMQAIALLGAADLAGSVEQAFDEARLLDDEREWFAATLAEAVERPADRTRFAAQGLGHVEDLVAELDDALQAAENDGEEPDGEAPVRNPLREVGRNDPCPCGSGRKHKKCCLQAT